MRINATLIAGAVGFALAAGAQVSSQAEGPTKSWGTKTTTYWSSDSTGQYEPGKFVDQPTMQPSAMPPSAAQPATQRRMYYQAPAKRVRATTRLRQQQPNMKTGQPPAEGTQPPANVKPGAPPSTGEPAQGQQPPNQGTTPK
jgi:hypothetical protein